jgi:hypothetical protein
MQDKFGSKIRITEESYTSKCSALDLEIIGKKDKYIGTREKRGLFVSKKGMINADLNGAINIMRKIIKLDKIDGKNIFNPLVIKIITPTRIKLNVFCDVLGPADKGNLQ